MTTGELIDIERRALRDEAARLKVINRNLLVTMREFASLHAIDLGANASDLGGHAPLEEVSRRIRNTARLAINKAKDSK